MFAYLSKKIGIPGNVVVSSISWNSQNGEIGVGGEKGLLKVIKLEDSKSREGAATAGGSLSVNHSLENHPGKVGTVVWNQKYRKLTSADDTGLIIVWMFHKTHWFQEMINNRNKSFVVDMKWSPDGAHIAIIYEDGAVIVGSVGGEREWGKDFKHRLRFVEWSPDCQIIIFGTPEGEVRIYDQTGIPIHQLQMLCLQRLVGPANLFTPNQDLAAIEWYHQAQMYTDDTPPGLIVAYECGLIQLMKNDKDDDPILIDTTMNITGTQWNPTGTIFAVCGTMNENGENKGVVQFYSNIGNHLKTLRIAGSQQVSSVSWEGSGLRVAMAVDSSIYFANIKPEHKWAYTSNNALIFGYQKSDRVEYSIIFWDTNTDTKNIQFVKNLCDMKAAGDVCCIVTQVQNSEIWQIDLCNSVGSPFDTQFINIEPVAITMTQTHIIVCSHDHVYIWQYRNQVARLTTFEAQTGLRKVGRETCWFIDNTNPDANFIYDRETYDIDPQTDDIICAVTANENFLFIGRISGSILQFTLPHVSFENKLFVKSKPSMMSVNSDSTRIAVIDINGILNLIDVNAQGGSLMEFEKKDCWYVKYSEDQPKHFVCMEKSRLFTVNDVTPDEPVTSEGYVCSFSDLVVKIVYLDDITKSGDGNLRKHQLISEVETKLLRDITEKLNQNSMNECFLEIQKTPYECLWRLFSRRALEEFDFINAEKGFLQLQDYKSLQFLKRLSQLDDKSKQRGEILAFYGKYDEAESLHIKNERKDLANQMRMKIGDWDKVLKNIKQGAGQDETLQKAHLELGHHYAERYQWDKAANYYSLAKNNRGMIDAYSKLEDYDSLEKIILDIAENDPLLIELGEKFMNAGLAENAVQCFERGGDVKRAVDCAVLLNHWGLAVQLAEAHGFVQIEGLLISYANNLLEQQMKLEAAELYRKANHNTQAAQILSSIADDFSEKQANPMYIQQLYVMAALEVDSYKKRVLEATMTGQATSTQKTLNTLITSTINTSTDKILNNPWRGAEAWHFFLLAQRHLYSKNFKNALKVALRLTEYELEINPQQIYSLVAICAYYNQSFKECSRAFVQLQGLQDISQQEKEKYQQIAASIFTKHTPKDSPAEMIPCPGKNCKEQISEYDTNCRSCGSNFQPCVSSGRSILQRGFYICQACRHQMIENEIQNERMIIQNCPLCHFTIDFTKFGNKDDPMDA